jgi:hypothetical protein
VLACWKLLHLLVPAVAAKASVLLYGASAEKVPSAQMVGVSLSKDLERYFSSQGSLDHGGDPG